MQKKLTRKEKTVLQQQTGGKSAVKQQEEARNKMAKLKMILGIVVAIIAFAVYANTLHHKYVLDDFGLIGENTQTKKGIHGLPEIFSSSYRTGFMVDNQVYRPLSKALFAIEWQIAPGVPAIGHWGNVILFAITCVVLFHVLTVFLKGNLVIPFIASLLFAVHPLHTEVVANIKGADEILCFLFCLLTAIWSYRYVTTKKSWYVIISSISLFVALLAKEPAATWIAVIPLFLYFFTDAKPAQYMVVAGSLLVSTIVFMLIRHRILGNVESPISFVDNYLIGINDFIIRKTTAIFLMGIYLKLFFFPHPLCSDGSFNHFPEVGPGDWRFLVPFVLFAAMAVYAVLRFRKKDLVSFGILYFFISVSIVSNLIVPIGTNYAERLLFIPSLGFCICIAALLDKVFRQKEELKEISLRGFFQTAAKPIGITAVVLVLFSMKTIARNADWYDSAALYGKDILTVPNSIHMGIYMVNYMTDDEILEALPDSAARTARMLEAIKILNHDLDIYPKYADAYQARAHLNYLMKNFAIAEPDFKKAIELNKTNFISQNNYGNLLFKSNRFDEAMEHYQMAVKYNPAYALAINNIGSVYGVRGQYHQQQSVADPAHKDEHLAESRKQFELAAKYFLQAIELDQEYVDPFNLLSITYRALGDNANAEKYAALAEKVKQRKEKIKHAKD